MRPTQAKRCRYLFILTTLLLAVVLPSLAVTLPVQTFQVDLSRSERFLIEQTVCGQKHGVAVAEIDARAFEANAAYANYADVKCRPHARLKDKPIYYVAQCARHDKQWSCGREELEVSVTLKARELIVRPGTVEPNLAYETIQKISTYGYFQAKSLDAALQSTCNMGMGNKPDLIEISCERWSITVSFWCPKKSKSVGCPRVIFMTPQN
jgi:hypothetical protein